MAHLTLKLNRDQLGVLTVDTDIPPKMGELILGLVQDLLKPAITASTITAEAHHLAEPPPPAPKPENPEPAQDEPPKADPQPPQPIEPDKNEFSKVVVTRRTGPRGLLVPDPDFGPRDMPCCADDAGKKCTVHMDRILRGGECKHGKALTRRISACQEWVNLTSNDYEDIMISLTELISSSRTALELAESMEQAGYHYREESIPKKIHEAVFAHERKADTWEETISQLSTIRELNRVMLCGIVQRDESLYRMACLREITLYREYSEKENSTQEAKLLSWCDFHWRTYLDFSREKNKRAFMAHAIGESRAYGFDLGASEGLVRDIEARAEAYFKSGGPTFRSSIDWLRETNR